MIMNSLLEYPCLIFIVPQIVQCLAELQYCDDCVIFNFWQNWSTAHNIAFVTCVNMKILTESGSYINCIQSCSLCSVCECPCEAARDSLRLNSNCKVNQHKLYAVNTIRIYHECICKGGIEKTVQRITNLALAISVPFME